MKNLLQLTKIVHNKAQRWVKKSGATNSAVGEGKSESSSLPEQKIFDVSLEKDLLKAFQDACYIIDQENILLQNDAPMEAMGLLTHKTAAIEHLHNLIESIQNLHVKPKIMSESLKEVQLKFNSIITLNDDLLKKSIHTQSVVMKILIDSASKAAQQGYNKNGDMVIDKSQISLSLSNKI